MTRCKECGVEISSGAKRCPPCGYERKGTGTVTKISVGIIGFFFLMASIEALFGGLGTSTETTSAVYMAEVEPAASAPETAVSPEHAETRSPFYPLKILEYGWERDEDGDLYVAGKAKNVGNKKLTYASIEVNFYAADGSVHGSSFDNIKKLGPGEIWSFKVIYFDDERPRGGYKITEVSTR